MLLILIVGDESGALIFIFLEFLIVITPRSLMSVFLIKNKFPQKGCLYAAFLRIGTLIPEVIFKILAFNVELKEYDEDVEENPGNERRGSRGGKIFFGVVYILFGVSLTLFFSLVLYSYYKNGAQPDHLQPNNINGPYPNQLAGQGQMNNIRNNLGQGIRANPGGVVVGQHIDDEILEGKNPQKEIIKMKGVESSLNGGLGKDSLDGNFGDDPLNNSIDDKENTPPDIDIYENAKNRVVDPNEQN
jgi:hypothetical protein